MDYSKADNNNESMSMKKESEKAGLEWQIDSDWIDLSQASITPSSVKRENKSKPSPKSSIKFHLTPKNNGERFLIVEQQELRLSQKTPSGYSYWVCNIPCCNAQCILDPEREKIVRYSGDHNHRAGVSRVVYKHFINALKNAVEENPHVKPKILYEQELKRIKDEWENSNQGKNVNEELSLPKFEDVQTAMHNTRNAILSAFSLRPAEESINEGKGSSIEPSRMTRSKDYSSPKKKSGSSKGVDKSPQDMEELEDMWTSDAHKDASLSDYEDWLEEDTPANISSPSMGRKARDTSEQSGLDISLENEEDMWDANMSLDKIPRRKYRKRPASMSVFTCPYCPYKSNRHFNVQRHERLAHSSKKPEFSCKECGTSYSLEYRLKLHIKAVHQGEGHHCHICARTFETMTGLKSHLMTKHKNEDTKVKRELPPELTCKLCCRVFTTKAHLLKHTSTHVMVQPYRCYACNQPFLDECTWLTHQNNCNEAFTIQCCLCSRVIPSAQELLTHMDEVHGRAEYSCSCGKSFPWKKSLLTHQQKCSLYLAEKAPVS